MVRFIVQLAGFSLQLLHPCDLRLLAYIAGCPAFQIPVWVFSQCVDFVERSNRRRGVRRGRDSPLILAWDKMNRLVNVSYSSEA